MKFSRTALALLAAVSLPALAAVAQQAAPGGPGQPGQGPSADMVARFQDGKLAAAKAMLRLSPEQEKLWGPVEEQIRASFAERAKMRAEHQAKRAERQAQKAEGQTDGQTGPKGRMMTALPERLDKATEMMTKRIERIKAFSAAVKPLYASLTDEQKLVANGVLGQFARGGKGGEHGWRHAGGRHHGWGGMRAEGGREGGWRHHGGRGGHMQGGMHRGMMGGMGGTGGDTGPADAPTDGETK